MEISGPVKTDQGWVFSLEMKVIDCDDAPVRVTYMSDHCKDAIQWAKEKCGGLFLSETDNSFLLGIIDDTDATLFKLTWM